MKELELITLSEPRFETIAEFFIAGLGDRFTVDKNEGIVSLWQAFVPHIGRVPNQVNSWNYGLCCNPGEDGSFEYIAGMEVSRVERLPSAFRYFKVPTQNYAVFRHLGHISTIHKHFSPFSITGFLDLVMSLPMPLSSNSTVPISNRLKAMVTWMSGYRFPDPRHHNRGIDL